MDLIKGIILCLILLSFFYYLFFMPLKTIDDFITRARICNILGLKNKELDFYKRALTLEIIPEKTYRDLNYLIGLWFFDKKQYHEATNYFDKAFLNYIEPILFQKEFKKVIKSYYLANRIEEGKKVLSFFLQQTSFDRKFHTLRKMERLFG